MLREYSLSQGGSGTRRVILLKLKFLRVAWRLTLLGSHLGIAAACKCKGTFLARLGVVARLPVGWECGKFVE